MILKSIFDHGQEIPQRYTCLGPNYSPPLYFEDLPEQARSLTLIVEDLDASPVPWTHWLVFNIPASTRHTEEGKIPEGGTEGLANNHTFGYEGPCPRYFSGTHRYRFSLYALDTILNLPATSEREDVEAHMQGHILAIAELSGVCTAPAPVELQSKNR